MADRFDTLFSRAKSKNFTLNNLCQLPDRSWRANWRRDSPGKEIWFGGFVDTVGPFEALNGSLQLAIERAPAYSAAPAAEPEKGLFD